MHNAFRVLLLNISTKPVFHICLWESVNGPCVVGSVALGRIGSEYSTLHSFAGWAAMEINVSLDLAVEYALESPIHPESLLAAGQSGDPTAAPPGFFENKWSWCKSMWFLDLCYAPITAICAFQDSSTVCRSFSRCWDSAGDPQEVHSLSCFETGSDLLSDC